MEKFSFRLDRLLKYRKYLEKQAQKHLFHARYEALKREEVLRRLMEKRLETERNYRKKTSEGMEVSWYRIYQTFFQKSDHDLETARIRLQKGNETVRVKRTDLEKKSVKKKTLEVLKEMQFRRYLLQLGKEDQKVMDELAVTGRKRKS
jgi:flagellar FliJ protein